MIQAIMKNNDLPEYVSVNEDTIDIDDRIEVVQADADGRTSKVNLVKMAFYYVQGYRSNEMAKIFEVTPEYIISIKNSEKFKNILTILNNEIISAARTFLTASGLKAVATLIKCLDSADDRIKLKASTEVLDRIGLNAVNKVEILDKSDKFGQMSEEELMAVVKMGMKEIVPKKPGVQDGSEHEATESSQG